MNRQRSIRYWVGNALILIALGVGIFTYYPLITLFFAQPVNADNIGNGYYLLIPKINAEAPIIQNVDPLNKTDYSQALEKGIAEARGSVPLGRPGTIYLFSHSSEPPWVMTRENTPFLRLVELQVGDSVKIYRNGKEYDFKVFDKKEVWPNEVQSIDFKSNQLILQTCTPVGTDLKRLLVFARPV